MNLGERIKKLRQGRNLLQRELADILGCSEKAISSYERSYRTPDVNTLNEISAYFTVSVDYLTRGTEDSSIVLNENVGEYRIAQQEHLSEVYSLLNEHAKRFTQKQESDLTDLIKWYIDKNIK